MFVVNNQDQEMNEMLHDQFQIPQHWPPLSPNGVTSLDCDSIHKAMLR